MKRMMGIVLLSALLQSFALVQPASAAFLIYDANDDAVAKVAKGSGTGVTDVAGAAAAMPSGGVDALLLAGHGESGVIGVGSGDSSGYHKGKDLMYGKLDDVAASLAIINGRLKDGSTVVLSGCYTGTGNHGGELLRELSKFLSKATIFANRTCVNITRQLEQRKGAVCTAQGDVYWQQSFTAAARNGESIDVGRDEMKKLINASCAP